MTSLGKSGVMSPELKTLVECFQCSKTETLTVLPCLHKVCRGCLAGKVSTEEQQAVIKCSACGTPSKVPPGGVLVFPSDSFSKLVGHRAPKKDAGPQAQSRIPLCRLHLGKVVTLYCRSCSSPCCKTCLAEGGAHHQHTVTSLGDAATHLDKLLVETVDRLNGLSTTMKNQMKSIKESGKRMETDLDKLKENATKLCGSIFVLPNQKTQLVEKVAELAITVHEKYAAGKDNLRAYLAEVDALRTYGTALRDAGTSAEKATHVPGLKRQGDVLKRPPQIYAWRTPQLPHFDQAASSYFKGDITPLINLEIREIEVPVPLSYPPESLCLDGISKQDLPGSVLGLVVLFEHIVVVRSRYGLLYVHTKEGRLHRGLTVPGLEDPRSLAVVNASEGRLVVGDHSGHALHWVTLDHDSLGMVTHGVQKLQAAPSGICLDNTGRVLVTADHLVICMPVDDSGQVVRDVTLTSSKWWPMAPVRTSHNCVAIRDRSSSYHVLYVDDVGNHVMYEQPELNSPRHMVPFSESFALAADRGDERFVVMGPFPGPIIHTGGVTVSTDAYESLYQKLLTHSVLTVTDQSHDITCLHVDQERSVIYVCQERGRQTVVKMVRFEPNYSVNYLTISLGAEKLAEISDSMLQVAVGPEGKPHKRFLKCLGFTGFDSGT